MVRLVGQSPGSVRVTFGIVAACFQFGPTICNNDVTTLLGGEPCGGANPININRVRHNPRAATTDGNGQTICSWGGGVQASIDVGAATTTVGDIGGNDQAGLSVVYKVEAAERQSSNSHAIVGAAMASGN